MGRSYRLDGSIGAAHGRDNTFAYGTLPSSFCKIRQAASIRAEFG